jgi:hypothetical protein
MLKINFPYAGIKASKFFLTDATMRKFGKRDIAAQQSIQPSHGYLKTRLWTKQSYGYLRTKESTKQSHGYLKTTVRNTQIHGLKQSPSYLRTRVRMKQSNGCLKTTLRNKKINGYLRTRLRIKQSHSYTRTREMTHQRHGGCMRRRARARQEPWLHVNKGESPAEQRLPGDQCEDQKLPWLPDNKVGDPEQPCPTENMDKTPEVLFLP